MPVELLGKSLDELRGMLESLGEPGYRGAQIYHALYGERRADFAAMTNLPVALRGRLAAEARITLPQIVRRYHSSDGSVRYLLALTPHYQATTILEKELMQKNTKKKIK